MNLQVFTKVLVIRPDGRILVIKRSQEDDRRAGEWDFPGGGVEPGENPTQGAVREVKEEVGIELSPNEVALFYAATAAHAPTNDSNTRIMYFAHISDTTADTIVLSHEHEAFKWEMPNDTVRNFPHPLYLIGLQYALDHDLLA